MTIFRNVVFVAALAGLLAGIVMTAMQTYATVPLILKAETFENAGGGHDMTTADAAAAECRRAHRTAERPRTSTTRKPGDRPTASSASPIRRCQHRHRHRLRAGSGRGFGIRRRHRQLAPGRVLGLCRLRRLHAGAGPRPAARTAGDACRRSRRPADLVDGDGDRHRRRPRPDRVPQRRGAGRWSASR